VDMIRDLVNAFHQVACCTIVSAETCEPLSDPCDRCDRPNQECLAMGQLVDLPNGEIAQIVEITNCGSVGIQGLDGLTRYVEEEIINVLYVAPDIARQIKGKIAKAASERNHDEVFKEMSLAIWLDDEVKAWRDIFLAFDPDSPIAQPVDVLPRTRAEQAEYYLDLNLPPDVSFSDVQATTYELARPLHPSEGHDGVDFYRMLRAYDVLARLAKESGAAGLAGCRLQDAVVLPQRSLLEEDIQTEAPPPKVVDPARLKKELAKLSQGEVIALAERPHGGNGRCKEGEIGTARFLNERTVEIVWKNGTRTRTAWPNTSWYQGTATQTSPEHEDLMFGTTDNDDPTGQDVPTCQTDPTDTRWAEFTYTNLIDVRSINSKHTNNTVHNGTEADNQGCPPVADVQPELFSVEYIGQGTDGVSDCMFDSNMSTLDEIHLNPLHKSKAPVDLVLMQTQGEKPRIASSPVVVESFANFDAFAPPLLSNA